jgi:hypothetical protein
VNKDNNLRPLYAHGIVFWDEHHKKVVLDDSSVLERRVYCDANGFPCSKENGGKLPEKRPRKNTKL